MKKKVLVCMLLAFTMMFTSCADPQVICGEKVRCHGIFNKQNAVEGVEYQVSVESVVWGCLGFQNVVMPVVLVGWYLYEPVPPHEQTVVCEKEGVRVSMLYNGWVMFNSYKASGLWSQPKNCVNQCGSGNYIMLFYQS